MWEVEGNLKTTTAGGWKTTEAHFWLFVSARIKKLSLRERESEQRRKGGKWKGRDTRAKGGWSSLCWPGKGSWAPALQEELQKLTAAPVPPSSHKGRDWDLPMLTGLKEKQRHTFPGHPGNEAVTAQDTTQHKRQLRNSEKHAGLFSPNLLLPRKIPSFLDSAIEEMRCNLLMWDSVSYTCPHHLFIPAGMLVWDGKHLESRDGIVSAPVGCNCDF